MRPPSLYLVGSSSLGLSSAARMIWSGNTFRCFSLFYPSTLVSTSFQFFSNTIWHQVAHNQPYSLAAAVVCQVFQFFSPTSVVCVEFSCLHSAFRTSFPITYKSVGGTVYEPKRSPCVLPQKAPLRSLFRSFARFRPSLQRSTTAH